MIWMSLKLVGDSTINCNYCQDSSSSTLSRWICLSATGSASKLLGVLTLCALVDLSMGLANKIAYKFFMFDLRQSKGLANKNIWNITRVGMATSISLMLLARLRSTV